MKWHDFFYMRSKMGIKKALFYTRNDIYYFLFQLLFSALISSTIKIYFCARSIQKRLRFDVVL